MERILIFEELFPSKLPEELTEEQKKDLEIYYGRVSRWIADATQEVTSKLSYPLKA